MIRRPPGSTRPDTLVPYTTLFRSMLFPLLALGACGDGPADPRGVEHDETLLSVSATGRSETRPDEARFTAGVSTIDASAEDATRRNNETMPKVTEALKAFKSEKRHIGKDSVVTCSSRLAPFH